MLKIEFSIKIHTNTVKKTLETIHAIDHNVYEFYCADLYMIYKINTHHIKTLKFS